MAETALIVPVPQADSRVRALREQFDPSARLGVPSHITVLFPFMSPQRIGPDTLLALQTALGQVGAFAFTLEKIGRFPATTYLAPEPSEPFTALTQAVTQRFPGFPPYRGEYSTAVPHLTVANGHSEDAERVEERLRTLMRQRGPIHAFCSAVILLENSSGRWVQLHEFALPRSID